jgi:chromosome segregation ATPase
MEVLQFIWLGGAVAGGALTGAAVCHTLMSRTILTLQQRLERTEQARNGALERSAQAREQIAQLNKAITDLRKAHAPPTVRESTAEQRRAAAEKALADARSDDKTMVLPRRAAPQSFADTEMLDNSH